MEHVRSDHRIIATEKFLPFPVSGASSQSRSSAAVQCCSVICKLDERLGFDQSFCRLPKVWGATLCHAKLKCHPDFTFKPRHDSTSLTFSTAHAILRTSLSYYIPSILRTYTVCTCNERYGAVSRPLSGWSPSS
jgi:hypothetical protein